MDTVYESKEFNIILNKTKCIENQECFIMIDCFMDLGKEKIYLSDICFQMILDVDNKIIRALPLSFHYNFYEIVLYLVGCQDMFIDDAVEKNIPLFILMTRKSEKFYFPRCEHYYPFQEILLNINNLNYLNDYNQRLRVHFRYSSNFKQLLLDNTVCTINLTKDVESADIIFLDPSNFNVLQKYKNRKHSWINILGSHEMFCLKHKLAELMNPFYMPKTYYILEFIPRQVFEDCHAQPDKLMICKPSSEGEGRGIFLGKFQNVLDKICRLKIQDIVIQEYIEPKKLNGKKFDIRIYGFVDSNRNFYLSKNGFLRFANKNYDPLSNDISVHLTNTTLNKNKNSIMEFSDWEESEKYFPQMNACFKELMENFFNHPQTLVYHNSFQIFGIDFMIGSDDKLYLIEINRKPSMACISIQQEIIKLKMVNEFVQFLLTISNITKNPKKNQIIQE